MNLSEIMFSYNSASGETGIRTITANEELYFSLFDVVKAIAAENRVLDPRLPPKRLISLIKAHITHLLPDEIMIRDGLPQNLDEPVRESYVTKAGLLRVVLQDNSPACVKFQKWVLNDVLPSVLSTGHYSYPTTMETHKTNVPTTENFDVEQMLRLQLQETIERKKADLILKSEVNQLASDVDEIKRAVENSDYICVREHKDVSALSIEEQYEIFVRCLNLCSLDNKSFKSRRVSNEDSFSKIFQRNVIDTAYTNWRKSKPNH